MIFFYYDSSLYNIEARVSSGADLTTTVLVARDKVVLDYGLGENAETSEVMVTPVTAGYTADCPNSETGERTICLPAEFQLGGVGYYMELAGDVSREKEMRRELAEIVALLISGGAADVGVLNPSRPEGRLNQSVQGSSFKNWFYRNIQSPSSFSRGPVQCPQD